ncbi:MAG: methylisocitrate lyase [Candidatus Caldarchaeum sp.]
MSLLKKRSAKPTAALRKLLKEDDIQPVPGVFNPVSAVLAERVGFKAVYLSGAALSGSLALPDLGLLTLSEVAYFTRLITFVVDVPVIADVDTGFGEVLNVMRTVRELEAAGAAAIQIEDQEMPKKCGHLSGKRVITPDEMVRRIRAAVDARTDPDFIIIARTDSRDVYGFDDAVKRALQYFEAGADIIFPEALRSEEEFREFARRVKAPLMANMTEFGKTPYIPVSKFGEMGYKLVIFPVTTFRASCKAVEEVLTRLAAEGTQARFLDKLQTREEFYKLIRYYDYKQKDRGLAGLQ